MGVLLLFAPLAAVFWILASSASSERVPYCGWRPTIVCLDGGPTAHGRSISSIL
jgi:hypothetical protein